MKRVDAGGAPPAEAHVARWLARAAAVAALAVACGAHARPPVDDFFRDAEMSGVELSPSGRYLAVVAGSATARSVLAVLDLEGESRPRAVARFSDADVVDVRWVNEERLVFGASDSQETLANRRARGLWSVDRDGGAMRQLIKRTWTEAVSEGNSRIARRLLEPDHYLLAVTADGGSDVIVGQVRRDNIGDVRELLLHRLDTRTGAIRPVVRPPDEHVVAWALDANDDPRAALSKSGNRFRLYWRAAAQTEWTVLEDYTSDFAQRMTPLWVDGDTLYVRTGHGPEETRALFRYDTGARRRDPEPVFSVAGFDFGGQGVRDRATQQVIGLRYTSDAENTQWLTPEMRSIQKEVDALLPGTVNRISCTRCSAASRLLVESWSDRQPPVFHVFDVKSRKLAAVGASRPWIQPRQMGQQDFARITARDGRSVPVYVTRPAMPAPGPLPAVVLVHGGPHVRGRTWGWSGESQFLASRGYVVIEPEFRGSDGYGFAHLSAGFGEWGRAMQDDVSDATRWAIASAGVDPKRICIAGASYGGYSALMGLIREPDLYRCGLNWVGVTEPALLFSIPWGDLPEDWKRYGLRASLGDPERDAARLEQVSAVAQAGRIRQPVLMAYGGQDRRVPIDHGIRMRDALERQGRPVEWVVYGEEGHGFAGPANRNDFWQRVERFLATHIGTATH